MTSSLRCPLLAPKSGFLALKFPLFCPDLTLDKLGCVRVCACVGGGGGGASPPSSRKAMIMLQNEYVHLSLMLIVLLLIGMLHGIVNLHVRPDRMGIHSVKERKLHSRKLHNQLCSWISHITSPLTFYYWKVKSFGFADLQIFTFPWERQAEHAFNEAAVYRCRLEHVLGLCSRH